MNEVKHTPLPWIVGPFGEIWPASDVEFVDGKWREKCPEPRIIASASKGNLLPNEDTANAAFIVRAVNCHDDMQAALETAQAALAMMIEPNSIEKTTLPVAFAQATEAEVKARAAIARARGDQS